MPNPASPRDAIREKCDSIAREIIHTDALSAAKAIHFLVLAQRKEALEKAADIALAIDSNRGNEKEIASAIRRLAAEGAQEGEADGE